MKAIAVARVLGPARSNSAHPKGTLTPQNEPILIQAPPFDEDVTPVQAISQRAAYTHGIVPFEKHWALIAVYRVSADALKRNHPGYEKIYVFEKADELERRRQLGVDEACIDPYKQWNSWYAVPESLPQEQAA